MTGFRRATQIPLTAVMVSTGLVMLSMIAVTWAVLSGGWIDNANELHTVVILAVLEGALLAQLSRSRLLAVTNTPVLAFLVIIPLTLSLLPHDVNHSPQDLLASYINASIFGIKSSERWTFTVGLATILWYISYNLGWLATREHRAAIGTLPAFGALGINALNAPLGSAVTMPSVVAGLLLILTIASSELGGLRHYWQLRRLPVLPGTSRRFGISVVVMVVGMTCLAAALPSITSADYSKSLFHLGTGVSSGPDQNVVGFSANVVPGGKLQSKPTPVFIYTANAALPYFRVENDGIFSAGNWSPGTPNAGTLESVDQQDIPRDRNVGDGGLGNQLVSVHTTIDYLSASTTGSEAYGLFPGEPDQTSLAGAASGAAGPDGLLTLDWLMLSGSTPSGITATYAGLVSSATAAQLRTAGSDYPAFVHSYAVWQHNSQANQIANLARNWTAGTSNPYDAASAIEAHLRDTRVFNYTLSPPAPPANQWPVVYFLTHSHAGYCQYYASSMGAMLRSLGIPARLVTGFGPGSPTVTRDGKQSSTVTVTTSDAHAWVEAYFPSYGWIPFEPTPASVLGNYNSIARGVDPTQTIPTPAPTATPKAGSTPTPQAHSTPTPAPRPGGNADAGNLPPLLGWLLRAFEGLLLMVLLIGGAALWMNRPRNITALWLRLRLLGALFGIRARSPADTDLTYTNRLIAALPADPVRAEIVDALNDIASHSTRDRFGTVPLTEAERIHLFTCWKRVLRESPRLIWHRSVKKVNPGSPEQVTVWDWETP